MTNTADQMRDALSHPYDWLEGDVRQTTAGPVMAHFRVSPVSMTLWEWLSIGIRSGRGLKLDFKEIAALEPTLQLARQMGVDDSKLIINVNVSGNPGENVSVDQLRSIRARFPRAILNLSVSDASYSPVLLRELGRFARRIGGPIMFPLRWDLTGPHTVAMLKPFGRVAIWNQPSIAAPADIAAETARLRSIGVDGMIDLRRV